RLEDAERFRQPEAGHHQSEDEVRILMRLSSRTARNAPRQRPELPALIGDAAASCGRIAAACLCICALGQGLTPGSRVGGFDLQKLDGTPAPFSSLRGSTTVVAFISANCPVS